MRMIKLFSNSLTCLSQTWLDLRNSMPSLLSAITVKIMWSLYLAHSRPQLLLCKMHTLPSDRYIFLLQLLLQLQQNFHVKTLSLSSLHSSSAWNFQKNILCWAVPCWLATFALLRLWVGLFGRIFAPRGIRVRQVTLYLKILLNITILHCTTTSDGSLSIYIGV